ncbi:hypothetical protein H8957_016707, partial [Semnopithecus entellus]
MPEMGEEGIQSLARETQSRRGRRQGWDATRVTRCRESLNRGVAGAGKRARALAHHVFLALIEPNLAEREASEEEVKARGDETVVADLLVKVVYVLGAIPGVFLREGNVLNQHSGMDIEKYSEHYLHDHSPGAEDDAAGGQLRPTAQERRHEEGSRGSSRCKRARKAVGESPGCPR